MTKQISFDVFTRSTFGMEPGGRLGSKLEAMAESRTLPPGREALFDHSEDKLVYVARGATKLSARTSEDRQQIVAFHFGGDVVSIPADSLYSYTLISLGPTELLVFPAREFFDQVAGEPPITRALFDRIPAALHRCRDKAVALGRKSAAERMAGFLLTMAERIGKTQGNRSILELPMSRRDIGDSLGLTIETVSRQLGALRKAGLIETSGRSHVVLRNLSALAQQAGHAPRQSEKCSPHDKFDLDQCGAGSQRIALKATEGA